MSIDASGALPQGGVVTISGSVSLSPFTPQLDISAKEVDLGAVAPHFAAYTGYELTAGSGAINTRLSSRQGRLEMSGRGFFDNIIIMNTNGREALAADPVYWCDLMVATSPLVVRVGSTKLARPRLNLYRDKDGRFRGDLLPPEVSASADPFLDESAPSWELGQIEIQAAELIMVDENTDMPVRFEVGDINGDMSGWSSRGVDPGAVRLEGAIEGGAAIRLDGAINPLAQWLPIDLSLGVMNLDARLLEGYFRQYAGCAVEKGRLFLDVEWRANRREFNGEIATRWNGATEFRGKETTRDGWSRNNASAWSSNARRTAGKKPWLGNSPGFANQPGLVNPRDRPGSMPTRRCCAKMWKRRNANLKS